MSADTAPAAMPGEEEIARLLRDEIGSAPACDYPSCIGGECGHECDRDDRSVEAYSAAARAILDLFAPILAEKQKPTVALNHWKARALDAEAAVRELTDAKQKVYLIGVDHAERRAAAEAALAAERERGARLLIAEYEAQTLCLLPILGEALKWRRRVTEDLKELIPYVAQIAAPGAAMEAL